MPRPRMRIRRVKEATQPKLINGKLFRSSAHVRTKTHAKKIVKQQFNKRAGKGRRKKGKEQKFYYRIIRNEKYGGYNVYTYKKKRKSQ